MDQDLVSSISCRELISTDSQVTGPRISIAQYNILADAAIPSDDAGFNICGSYKFCPSEYRYMKYRHKKIVHELKCLNADILAVQEIEAEHFYNSLKQDLAGLGYSSVSHTRFFDHIGMAIFYKTEKLSLRNEWQFIIHKRLAHHLSTAGISKKASVELVDHLITCSTYPGIIQPPGCVMACFEHLASGQSFCVATTHITWKRMQYPSMQILQAYTVLQELHLFARGQPSIIAADFNAEPNSPLYQMMSSGQICQLTINLMLYGQNYLDVNVSINGEKMVDLLRSLKLPLKLTSCYLKVQGSEPMMTTLDESVVVSDEEEGLYGGCVDYIWCVDNFHPVAVLRTPAKDILTADVGIPSKVFPSDHIPIYCELILAATT